MSIYTKIENGNYKNRMPYPTRPSKPAILGQKVGDLTNDELASIPAVRIRYETLLSEYKEALAAYNQESNRLETLFQDELEKEYGTENHPKKSLLYSKAWDRGHSGGMSEVVAAYVDYLELLED